MAPSRARQPTKDYQSVTIGCPSQIGLASAMYRVDHWMSCLGPAYGRSHRLRNRKPGQLSRLSFQLPHGKATPLGSVQTLPKRRRRLLGGCYHRSRFCLARTTLMLYRWDGRTQKMSANFLAFSQRRLANSLHHVGHYGSSRLYRRLDKLVARTRTRSYADPDIAERRPPDSLLGYLCHNRWCSLLAHSMLHHPSMACREGQQERRSIPSATSHPAKQLKPRGSSLADEPGRLVVEKYCSEPSPPQSTFGDPSNSQHESIWACWCLFFRDLKSSWE